MMDFCMKQYIPAFLALAAVAFGAQAQQNYTTDEQGLIETVAKIEKKTDKFNMYFNMHGDFETNWTGSQFEGGKFQMKQFRIEFRGDINDWLSYRYRQRVNKGDDTNGYRDNLWRSIDIAGIGVKLDKWQFFLGKQCAAYGGIEFDLNPIEIYQYSDMVDYMTNFMSGVNIAYNFNSRQQLQFQMLNAINGPSEEMYGNYRPCKFPMVYTLNWNGTVTDWYKTRWSASVMREPESKNMYYFALGNDFSYDKFGAYFDWMYSIEGIDRKGIMTEIIGADNGFNQKKADYMSFVWHLNYRIAPKWNIFAKVMYETAGLGKGATIAGTAGPVELKSGNYRTSWGYIGGIEFYPLQDRNLHFFLTYVGRDYKYSGRAFEINSANHDYNTNRLSCGFIWQMPVF